MELHGELFHAIILVIIITWDSMGNPFMQSVVFSDNNYMELHGELFHAIDFVIIKKFKMKNGIIQLFRKFLGSEFKVIKSICEAL